MRAERGLKARKYTGEWTGRTGVGWEAINWSYFLLLLQSSPSLWKQPFFFAPGPSGVSRNATRTGSKEGQLFSQANPLSHSIFNITPTRCEAVFPLSPSLFRVRIQDGSQPDKMRSLAQEITGERKREIFQMYIRGKLECVNLVSRFYWSFEQVLFLPKWLFTYLKCKVIVLVVTSILVGDVLVSKPQFQYSLNITNACLLSHEDTYFERKNR